MDGAIMKHFKAELLAISTSIVGTNALTEPTTVMDLPDGMMFPEAIVEDGNGLLYVSVFESGTLLRNNETGQSEVFKSPGEDGMTAFSNDYTQAEILAVPPQMISQIAQVQLQCAVKHCGSLTASLITSLMTAMGQLADRQARRSKSSAWSSRRL
jgi:hypothetical protein